MPKTNRSYPLIALVIGMVAVILTGVMLMRKNHLAAEVQALENTLAETQQAYDTLVADKTVWEKEAKALNETLETAQLDLEDATYSLEKANTEIAALTADKAALETRLTEETQKRESLSAALTDEEQLQAEAALAQQTTEKSAEELTAALAELEAENALLRERLKEPET